MKFLTTCWSPRYWHSLLTLLVVGLLALTGCQSTNRPRSTSLASVVIESDQTSLVRTTARDVFMEHLFRPKSASDSELILEKPGNKMAGMTYGTWFDNNVWIRVRVTVTRYRTGYHLVECDAYAIRAHGDAFFEDENKLTKIHRPRFKGLLKEVKKRVEKVEAQTQSQAGKF